MGIVYETSKWTDALMKNHIKHSPTAQAIIADGRHRQAQFPHFANDVHSLLYLKHAPQVQENSPVWANELIKQAQDLPEWHMLRARCQRSGFAAGCATESILGALLPMVPQGQEPPPQDASTTRRHLRQACRDATQAIDQAESTIEGIGEALGIHAGDGVGHAET